MKNCWCNEGVNIVSALKNDREISQIHFIRCQAETAPIVYCQFHVSYAPNLVFHGKFGHFFTISCLWKQRLNLANHVH